jgi:DtxR family Mn-dependent transcriptional regulator
VTSSTVENYVKQLYVEQEAHPGEMVLMGRLAAAMEVAPGTATSMVKTLADAGLADYQPRGGVRLTARGQQLALHVLRRHRLVELFLVKILGLDWSEVHDEAEALEHVVSDLVLDRIDELLGYPTVDPHGDPIPTSSGRVHDPKRMNLASCPIGRPQRIVRVLDQNAAFLQFIERQGLMPGTKITVLDREPAADAVRLRLSPKRETTLGLAAANKILVEAAAKA